jgi:hypothetical protein
MEALEDTGGPRGHQQILFLAILHAKAHQGACDIGLNPSKALPSAMEKVQRGPEGLLKVPRGYQEASNRHG